MSQRSSWSRALAVSAFSSRAAAPLEPLRASPRCLSACRASPPARCTRARRKWAAGREDGEAAAICFSISRAASAKARRASRRSVTFCSPESRVGCTTCCRSPQCDCQS
ncbi:MAG: hypothetical protein QM765_33455 [Myxococcales bacterium]